MPPQQREVAIRSINIARQSLDITINSPAYRELLPYSVHYTLATATFAASFLLRLTRLLLSPQLSPLAAPSSLLNSPDDCDANEIRIEIERLSNLLGDRKCKRRYIGACCDPFLFQSAWRTAICTYFAGHAEEEIPPWPAQVHFCLSITYNYA
jgi:hypothetical protein